MWIMVFFDLPVGTKTERRHANRFRKFLKTDGYLMLQFSVYARICRSDVGVEKHLLRARANLPPRGSVRALQVTDKQYARMKFLVGDSSKSEKKASDQLVLL